MPYYEDPVTGQRGTTPRPGWVLVTTPPGATSPGSSATPGGSTFSPEIDEAYRLWTALGLGDEQFWATFNQGKSEFDQNLAFQRWQAEASLASAERQAQIAAASGDARARAAAQAQVEAARIQANATIRAASIDAASRERIVAKQLAVQMRELVSERTARPIDWPKQIAMLGGVPAARAPTTGVQEYLTSPIEGVEMPTGPLPGVPAGALRLGTLPTGQAVPGAGAVPVAGQGDEAWQRFRQQQQNVAALGGRPLAVVGEAGPEMITQQGRNLQVRPMPRVPTGYAGIPRMQYGGTVTPSPYGDYQGRPRANRGGRWGRQPPPGRRQPRQPAQPTQPTAQTQGMSEFGEQLFNPWPAFQASTLSREMPGGGGYQTARPWEMNLNEFLNAPTQVQDARLAVWRQQGVIAGETPEEMWRSAMQMMRQAAFVGGQRGAVSAYG